LQAFSPRPRENPVVVKVYAQPLAVAVLVCRVGGLSGNAHGEQGDNAEGIRHRLFQSKGSKVCRLDDEYPIFQSRRREWREMRPQAVGTRCRKRAAGEGKTARVLSDPSPEGPGRFLVVDTAP